MVQFQFNSWKNAIVASTAIAAATTFHKPNSTISTNAFSTTSFTTTNTAFIQSNQNSIKRSRNWTRCLSSTTPTVEPINEESTIEATILPTTTTTTTTSENEMVVARGDMISFVPSPNGKSGIMAVKLIEEDFAAVTAPPVVPTDEELAMDEDKKSSSTTGMFGGEAARAAAAAKAPKISEGEDYTGKKVRFSNGQTGFVIAQRPPMAFVLCDFANPPPPPPSSQEENDDEKVKVSLLRTRSSVKVGNHMVGSIVDYLGNPLNTSTTTTTTTTTTVVNKEDTDDDVVVVERSILAPIPQVKDIALINSPLLTGTSMVDALAPIGKGQNMLVIGQDSGVGQREFLITAIQTQVEEAKKRASNADGSGSGNKNSGDAAMATKIVYALTSSDKKEREDVLSQLKDAGVLNDIIVVSARDDDDAVERTPSTQEDKDGTVADAAEAIAVAATACSIGEAFALTNGEDALVIIDDIDQHKALWDWTTRVLVDFYGVDAVVKADIEGGASSEMRAFYSSLIQRAAKYKDSRGGGSVTLSLLANLPGQFGGEEDKESMTFTVDDFEGSSEKVKERIDILVKKNIPLTPETLRKIQIPVPVSSDSEKERRLALQHMDDLISMSDGQIWFDEILYSNGQRPAMDAQRSITRVGIGADTKSRADAPAMRTLAGGLRFDFAQADSLDGAGLSSGADKQLLMKKSYLLAMHQEVGEFRTLSENCAVLLAASLGSLNNAIEEGNSAGTEQGKEVIDNMLAHVWQSVPDTMKEIDSSLDLTPPMRSLIEDTIKEHFSD